MLDYCSELVTASVGHSSIAYNEIEMPARIRGFSDIRH